MAPRKSKRGLTLIEMLLSVVLFGTITASLMNVFIVGESSYFMGEASLQSHQTARNALDVIQQGLSGARIVSYYDGSAAGQGNGKVYVKFRRIEAVGIVDANGQPIWSGTFYMYIWCPNGETTPGVSGFNACQFIQPAPQPGQLLLVRSATGLNNQAWLVDRVLVAGSAAGNSSSQGFVTQFGVQAVTATDDPPSPVPMANQTAGGGCAASAEGECISPFTGGPPVRLLIQLTSQVSATVFGGRRVLNAPVAGRITLRNPQN